MKRILMLCILFIFVIIVILSFFNDTFENLFIKESEELAPPIVNTEIVRKKYMLDDDKVIRNYIVFTLLNDRPIFIYEVIINDDYCGGIKDSFYLTNSYDYYVLNLNVKCFPSGLTLESSHGLYVYEVDIYDDI